MPLKPPSGIVLALISCVTFGCSDGTNARTEDAGKADSAFGPGDAMTVAPTCVSRTCQDLDADCGPQGDGCGGTIQCGTCQTPKVCGGGGMPNRCGDGTCAPLTCASQSIQCGPAGNGCGALLQCGSCNLPETCGGGGQPSVCGGSSGDGGSGDTGTSDAGTNDGGTAMGPLTQSTVNSRYLVDPAGQAVFLVGSHTWDDLQDTDTTSSPAAVDFSAYVTFLKTHGHNATILWRKDLPHYCGWANPSRSWSMGPSPWMRTGPGTASDGNPKFDLTQFNQAYFDRLRTRVIALQQSGIYAIVELFDGNNVTSARCGNTSPSGDGFPFTGVNNVNGVSDGYTSGAAGVGAFTMTTNNAITDFEDAYVKKVIDTLNDLPNVMWEVAEEQPGSSFSGTSGYGGASSMSYWAPHMFGLIKTYEAGKPLQHVVGIGSMNSSDFNDAALYSSAAEWIGPMIGNNFSDQFPAVVATSNQAKVVLNDSDHALGFSSFINSDGSIQDGNLRGYLWENITNGAGGLLFMDPYLVDWRGTPSRNSCSSPNNGICTSVDTKYDAWRDAMGFALKITSKIDFVKATPQSSLATTGHCLANNAATGAEYLVYTTGSAFSLNLSATTRTLSVEWLNPQTGAILPAETVVGGSSSQSFTPPFNGDAVLYVVDSAGHA